MTALISRDVRFDGKAIAFPSACSGREAKKAMAKHPDTAIIRIAKRSGTYFRNGGAESLRHGQCRRVSSRPLSLASSGPPGAPQNRSRFGEAREAPFHPAM